MSTNLQLPSPEPLRARLSDAADRMREQAGRRVDPEAYRAINALGPPRLEISAQIRHYVLSFAEYEMVDARSFSVIVIKMRAARYDTPFLRATARNHFID